MKRIFWGSVRALCGLGIWAGSVLLGAPARAQAVAAGRAQVYAVTAADFKVPQVKLADAAVARRINRALLRLIVGANADGIDLLATPQQQLRQADRESRYDTDQKVLRRYGQGFVGADYNVLLNQNYLLSFAFHLEYMGAYPSQADQHATFDLRTGRGLRLVDVVADPPEQLQRRMQGAISRRVGEHLGQIAADPADKAEVADLAERFHWNAATRQVVFEMASRPEAAAAVGLNEFALTPRALLLFYRFELPHVIQNFEPDDTYRFPYARVHPRGPLVPLADAAGAPKKP
ncbi:hypothetical protein [Hymenobacter sp. PAMC 26628]|uniref:hypothetical protein n=1 Tax=Hymenobacter sp. PAMC 26628 TaxID=1484118 RepID=UPI0007704390|nr:hypothetical protein [Hymenobacter sp. PAMC 26628]AMJ65888.1 hypothetical protein AXW84_10940 [Hymenobacter sp. PAMC 26628]